MGYHTSRMELGNATISIFNVGNFVWTLADKLNVPEHMWRPDYATLFEQPLLFPTQCIHVQLPNASVLIDASRHDPFPRVFDDQQQPELVTQLLAQGIAPEDITHIVITHAHSDHYAGVTREHNGQVVPCFPHARCMLNQADWNMAALQQALLDPTSLESHTLGVLHTAGMLETTEGDVELFPGLEMIAAPGETPGHQIVRVCSQNQTLYCVGDLYHHSIEIEHPTWMTRWSEYETKLCSRQRLMEKIHDDHALLVAAHVPIGYIEQTPLGPQWRALDTRE